MVETMENNFINKPLEKRDYSFVILPDTQNIVERKPEYYFEMMNWINNNKNEYNIKAVFHMGDIVNENTDSQWEIAKNGIDIIKDIPFIPMMGNHDSKEMFDQYIKYSDYKQKDYFGGAYYNDSLSHFYWFVNSDKKEYLIISLGWAPSWDVLDWADNIIKTYNNKNVIIISHALMHRNGCLLQKHHNYSITSYEGYEHNPEGFEIWNFFKKHNNVVLTLSGHISSSDISVYKENNVPSLLFDNQDEDKWKHLCMMGILSFNEENDNCFVNYYSFKENALYKESNQFEVVIKHIK